MSPCAPRVTFKNIPTNQSSVRTVAAALREAAALLADTSDTARLDAELLMAHALGATRGELLLRRQNAPEPESFRDLVDRRCRHEPVAYILGEQEFFGLSFHVSPAVLIPRADSETLVEAALAARPGARTVLDCGTGSGALLLAVLANLPDAGGVGIDRSEDALVVASTNARDLGLAARASMRMADWTKHGWTADLAGLFDLILANPPYVEDAAALAPSVRGFEPGSALFAGPDGLDDYRLLLPQLPGLLAAGGAVLVEIGSTQAGPVSDIAAGLGFAARLHRDLGSRPRVLELSREG